MRGFFTVDVVGVIVDYCSCHLTEEVHVENATCMLIINIYYHSPNQYKPFLYSVYNKHAKGLHNSLANMFVLSRTVT